MRKLTVLLRTFVAGTNGAQVIEGINARAMAVAPMYANGIRAHRFGIQHFERRLEHLERVGSRGGLVGFRFARRRAMRAGAGCAGALIAKIDESVIACVAILPIDLDPFRFGDRDMFRIGVVQHGRQMMEFSAGAVRRRERRRCGASLRLIVRAVSCRVHRPSFPPEPHPDRDASWLQGCEYSRLHRPTRW